MFSRIIGIISIFVIAGAATAQILEEAERPKSVVEFAMPTPPLPTNDTELGFPVPIAGKSVQQQPSASEHVHSPSIAPCGVCKACQAGEPCEIIHHAHCPHGICIYEGRILACDVCNPQLPDGIREWIRAKYPCVHGFYKTPQLGHAPYREYGDTRGGIPCDVCRNAVTQQPCGQCEACKAGYDCMYAPRCTCVIPSKLNSCNTCDFRLDGKPCGTCDSCRENGLCHEPCGHQRFGMFNPANEPRFLAATPRPIVAIFNGRGHRVPIYYNPAPYYKPYWNSATWQAHQRPFTFAFSCPSCSKEKCDCNAPGKAGQITYAFTCKFCKRNPCSCIEDICKVNDELDPKRIAQELKQYNEERSPKTQTPEMAPEPLLPTPIEDDGPLFDQPAAPPQKIMSDKVSLSVPRKTDGLFGGESSV